MKDEKVFVTLTASLEKSRVTITRYAKDSDEDSRIKKEYLIKSKADGDRFDRLIYDLEHLYLHVHQWGVVVCWVFDRLP